MMFRWLRTFFRQAWIADVPAESALCVDCEKLECSEGEFQYCAARKTCAAELAAGEVAPATPGRPVAARPGVVAAK